MATKAGFPQKINQKLRLNFGGTVFGLLFFCLSQTPSLLPRGFVLQGVTGGLSAATGYAVGVMLSVFYHAFPSKWRLKLTRLEKRIIVSFSIVAVIVFVIAGVHWQEDIRKLVEASSQPDAKSIFMIIIALLVTLLLIWAARGIRRLGRFFGRKLQKFLPVKVAAWGGGILAAIVIVFLVNGVLFKALFGLINYTFGLANDATPPGIYQPQNDIFSGSPQSDIDWNTLGEKGREFVASAPTQSDIEQFNIAGVPTQPSRLYAGLQLAPTLKERVDLLVKELNRTNAAKRKAVLIAIPTGSGGINAKSVESVEYLFDGDTTSLGIQYSYLPSWLSFLADQETARENGQVLVDAVYDWWKNLPSDNRPKLLMYGESLGTLGADGAFSGPDDLENRMDGVLLAGPPNANQLWRHIVENRDPNSPEVLPVYQKGASVRFSNGESFYANPKNEHWSPTRIGFLQNASDPVIWASTSLFLHKPDWLREPRGSDVLPNMRWYPFVTGWQVALDLPFAFSATPGHGHRYGSDFAQAWTAILSMQLTTAQSQQLGQIIANVKG